MLLRYFYNRSLAHASYMVGCQQTGDAIIVDPGRDSTLYLDEAEAQDMRITAVTETHIHADYLSGARELAERTGATLYLSDEGDENWKYQFADAYPHMLLKDGATFLVGNIQFETLHTPGHTPEHISFLVTDRVGANKPMGAFTGDFVFVGDVGRPDLLERVANMANTAEIGARQLFHSLQRFKECPDFLQVWPAHGAGSACGKDLGAVPSSTLGYEKLFNWAFSYTDEDEFAQTLLDGQPAAPRYFAMMKQLNKAGPPLLVERTPPEQLPLEAVVDLLAAGAPVVDTRPAEQYAEGHVAGTLNIPAGGSFANWAGWLLDYETPFYLVASAAEIETVLADLTYIGLDNVAGFVDAALVAAQPELLQSYQVLTPEDLGAEPVNGDFAIVDVRYDDEWQAGHLPGAQHVMLGELPQRIDEVPRDKPILVYCQSGARSAIGSSILRAHGAQDVINLMGGWLQWNSAGLPVERNET